jgi:hypothetical protein
MKATKAEVAKRVEETGEIRLAGAGFADIRRYAAQNGWGVSDRQLWRYIRAAGELMAKDFEEGRHKLLVRHLAQRRALYARALQIGDYRTALAVARDEAELQGLYSPRKVALTDPSGDREYNPDSLAFRAKLGQILSDDPVKKEAVAQLLREYDAQTEAEKSG